MRRLLLIDANSLIHRAFHALPPLTAKGGRPTGALYGLASILIKTLGGDLKPDFIIAAFDRPEPTFRKEMFKEYKAHRPKAPDELISQIIEAHNLFEKFGVKFFEKPGFEADDIIGTFAKKFEKERDLQIVVLTGDLDTLQLVDQGHIVVQILKKGVSETQLYDEKAVIERYGLNSNQMTDYKGLVGDASDNIPGVRGIGPKTAEEFLKKYGHLENLFKKMAKDDPAAKKIRPFEKEALFSKKLATINCGVPIEVELKSIAYSGFDKGVLPPYFESLGFESLVRRLNGGEEKEKQPKPLNQGLFAFEPEKKNETHKFGDFDVAWSWKPVIKKLIREKKNLPKKIFDLGVAAWVLNSDETDFGPAAIMERFSKDGAEGLFSAMEKDLKKNGLENIFHKIEMPLVPVLAWMEIWGISVDGERLAALGKKMAGKINLLTEKIHKAAGETFNINSSQQLAEIIFDKLEIKPAKNKKTPTGRRSTSEEVLLSLKDAHPIIPEILEYRETFKINSTYVEPLLQAKEKDGRVRTTFIQTGAATGRLASEKPNLQNVPQESSWSKELRETFVASPGFTFASFDYAQLELRLLAHMTLEKGLLSAFEKNQDIHSLTASRVLKIPFDKITQSERRLGKTLNFGVVYGMGPRAFAQSAGVSFIEAKKFIDGYYREFPKIKKWQEKIKTEAKARGYVENLNGRRRYFWTDARHPKVMGEIERAAVNMPLQSLNADILKTAMIKSFELMKNKKWFEDKVRLILTIHDELLFEVRDDILIETVPLFKDLMEKIYPLFGQSLALPLKVEAKTGKNWGNMGKYENV
ncbi:MAG: DNA polymerase [Patescibacteria group bacterium]